MTAATNGTNVCPPDDTRVYLEYRWKNTVRGGQKFSENICPSDTLTTKISTVTELGANPGLRSEKAASNCL